MAGKSLTTCALLLLACIAFIAVPATCDQTSPDPLIKPLSRTRPAGFPSEEEANATAQRWIETSEALFRMAKNARKERSASHDKVSNRRMLDSAPTCDCDYHAGGCTISKPAPEGMACKCSYDLFWTCSGTVVTCSGTSSPFCQTPDSSIGSCYEGGGDCGGYKDTCDCDYHPGGCRISKTAPGGTACHCSYEGAWTCGGSVTMCRDSNAQNCITPDNSVSSCNQGGGDCGGY